MTGEYEFCGIHYIANYSQCKEGTLTNITILKDKMTEAVISSGATIIQMVDYVFKSDNKKNIENNDENDKNECGYTSMYLLSESHATIHTYPEVKSCFIDIFTCGDKCSYIKFDEKMREYLQPEIVKFEVIRRNTEMERLYYMNNG